MKWVNQTRTNVLCEDKFDLGIPEAQVSVIPDYVLFL